MELRAVLLSCLDSRASSRVWLFSWRACSVRKGRGIRVEVKPSPVAERPLTVTHRAGSIPILANVRNHLRPTLPSTRLAELPSPAPARVDP